MITKAREDQQQAEAIVGETAASAWVAPAITRFAAGSAEAGAFTQPDGVGIES